MKKRRSKWFVGCMLGLAIFGGTGAAFYLSSSSAEIDLDAISWQIPQLLENEFTIKRNSTVYDSLMEIGFTPQEIREMVLAAKPYQDLGRIRAGTRYQIYSELGPIRAPAGVKFNFSPTEYLEVKREAPSSWVAQEIEELVETKLVTYSGIVSNSLWESATDATMDPNLIAELTEIFAWQVDFSREVRPNDRWRLTVEQRFVRGEPIGWGRIVTAEYQNVQNVYTAVLFRDAGKELGYFAPDGTSLRRMFLKAPIRFGRISSRFRMRRFHPVLRENRPHLGVDYAAPTGTPIRAVGNGTVTFAGYRGGGGKTIKIRHNSVYQTAYKHLNGYAPGIRSGSRVQQGQVIGYVGSTGLSTGPHLHFEFYEHGRFIDPLGKKFPSADPVPKKHLGEFQKLSDRMLATLPPWFRPGVTLSGPVLLTSVESSDL